MQEIKDFEFFKEVQMCDIDFYTGRLDTIRTVVRNGKPFLQRRLDVGSVNPDGYIRVWCNGTLRMKHRLLFWLYHGYLPEEIDHMDKNRSNNCISNLRPSNRKHNTKGITFNGRRRFTQEELHNICKDIATGTYSDINLADKYQCTRTAIMGIRVKRRHGDIASQYF